MGFIISALSDGIIADHLRLTFSHNTSATDDDGQTTDDTLCHRRLQHIAVARQKTH